MCITLSAAELSNTKLYAGEATRGGKYVHVMAYQNKAASPGPNAMILPIPAATMLGPDNLIDTRSFRSFLDDIQDSAQKYAPLTFGAHGGEDEAQVFDVGSYTVILAEGAQAIERALSRIPDNKRPGLNADILRSFEVLYAGWPLAVCCWDGAINAEPLLLWYEPMKPSWLFAPALDAHDGNPPNTRAYVEVDHDLAFGSTLSGHGIEVTYHGKIPANVRELLPTRVRGCRISEPMYNGDFWRSIDGRNEPALRRAPDEDKPNNWIEMFDAD